MNIFSNVVLAGLAVAAAPIAAVADVLTLPSSAYDNKPPFERTGAMLGAAGASFKAAITPEVSK